jgi:type IX secretion system PorP/SprF family membrane protein
MKKYIILFLLAFQVYSAKAQQYPLISQYMFNGLFLNPAYAGQHQMINTSLLHRSQWVGFDGAPRTSILSADGMIGNSTSHAIGGILYHDRIGATNETDLSVNYAYHIRLGETTRMSFGVRAGAAYYNSNLTNLNVWEEDDVFMNNINRIIPKAGFGTFLYADNYFAGISIPTLLAYENGMDVHPDITRASHYHRHYLLNGGYVHTINENLKIRPSTLIKFMPRAPVQADINLNALLYDMFEVGVSYRTGDAVVFMTQFNTNNGFRIGYAFDLTTTQIRRHSHGSHEIFLAYNIARNITDRSTARFY